MTMERTTRGSRPVTPYYDDGRLTKRPCTLKEARAFVAQVHRHSEPPQGWLFGTSLVRGDETVGVVTVGRPVGRGLQDGYTAEITRVATRCVPNACSMLYGAGRAAADALGYRRVITYTLATECGACPRAAGFVKDADLPAREAWVRSDQGRYPVDLFGTERHVQGVAKTRWVWQR